MICWNLGHDGGKKWIRNSKILFGSITKMLSKINCNSCFFTVRYDQLVNETNQVIINKKNSSFFIGFWFCSFSKHYSCTKHFEYIKSRPLICSTGNNFILFFLVNVINASIIERKEHSSIYFDAFIDLSFIFIEIRIFQRSEIKL